MKKHILSLVLIPAVFITLAASANVKLATVFSDGMVMQQQTDAWVWGWAKPGERIKLSASWSGKSFSATADEKGNWKIKIATGKAGGPFTMHVTGENDIEVKDILIGEVWVCSGQSNMVFSLKSSEGAKEEISRADNPSIRYFSVKRQYGLQNFEDCEESAWEKSSPATAGSFSAVAYYFAKKIQQELHVPVGIVYSAWGGTPAEAWTPRDVIEKDQTLHRYIDRWSAIQRNVGKDSIAYHDKLSEWEQARTTADSNKVKKPGEPQTLYYFNRPWREPAVLFNGMIDPVIPYAVKGVLWYQGESNVAFADEYAQLFGSMINSWRNRWKEKGYSTTMPFYFVQIASYGYASLDAAARLRDAQYEVMNTIPNTGMAVTTDVGNMNDIHYTHKKEVGDRLAFIALAKDYGKKTTVYKGPVLTKAVKDGDKAVLQFGSSTLMPGSNTLTGFEIGSRLVGADSIVFSKASAKIEGDKIIVWNEAVKQPVAVRYAWLLAGESNLFNKDGLPAFPFKAMLK